MAQTVFCFDVGTKKIGVAVGQSVTASAQALAIIAVRKGVVDWVSLTKAIDEWQPDHFVIGLPHTADGKKTPLILFIERFARELTRRYVHQTSFIDERLSSAQADHHIRSAVAQDATRAPKSTGKKRLAMRDAVAAQLLLESWFSEIR